MWTSFQWLCYIPDYCSLFTSICMFSSRLFKNIALWLYGFHKPKTHDDADPIVLSIWIDMTSTELLHCTIIYMHCMYFLWWSLSCLTVTFASTTRKNLMILGRICKLALWYMAYEPIALRSFVINSQEIWWLEMTISFQASLMIIIWGASTVIW